MLICFRSRPLYSLHAHWSPEYTCCILIYLSSILIYLNGIPVAYWLIWTVYLLHTDWSEEYTCCILTGKKSLDPFGCWIWRVHYQSHSFAAIWLCMRCVVLLQCEDVAKKLLPDTIKALASFLVSIDGCLSVWLKNCFWKPYNAFLINYINDTVINIHWL